MSSRSSRTDPADAPGDRVPATVRVARVRRPHGVAGAVLLEVHSDVPDRLTAGAELLLEAKGGRHRVRLASVRPRGDLVLARFEGIDDRDGVEGLQGAWLEVEGTAVPPPPDGLYYHFQLQGCAVSDRRAGALGRVSDVIEDGGGLILEVRRGGEVLLVPFVEACVGLVDVAGRRIELDLPEGLIEACTSRS